LAALLSPRRWGFGELGPWRDRSTQINIERCTVMEIAQDCRMRWPVRRPSGDEDVIHPITGACCKSLGQPVAPRHPMNCPKCGKSLWFVKDVCPFCKNTLAPETPRTPLAPPAPGDSSDPDSPPTDGDVLVTVIKCETLAEADAIRSRLEAADIAAFLPDESLMQNVAWNANTYGFVRVQVASGNYEAARRLLSSLPQEVPTTSQKESGANLAGLPLSWPMRCFAFVMPLLLCPGLLIFAVARGGYSRQGCERKARELWQWFAGGVVFWVLVFVVFATVHDFLGN
jgi:hypothetical protein